MAISCSKPVTFAAVIGCVLGPLSGAQAENPIPLKEAKLNIEHNATDHDTGFQGGIDSEGWKELTIRGPGGEVLSFEPSGKLRTLGLTELFFETVEPGNADVPIAETLSKLPAGNYQIFGPAAGSGGGTTAGTAWLTHVIPAGPILVSPPEGSAVFSGELLMKWKPVTKTINGGPVNIIAYQLIVEKVGPPHRHMIGKRYSLSMYLPPTATQITLPRGFLQRAAAYDWEVLAVEQSGNQTLSSGKFQTR